MHKSPIYPSGQTCSILLLTPQEKSKRPPIQIMTKLITVNFIHVHGLSSPKEGFKRSDQDVGKIRVFIA